MNPLTVAILIITLFSVIAGIFISQNLLIPRLGSRREAFVAAGSGAVTLVGLYLAGVLPAGHAMLVVLCAPITMVIVCTMGALHEAIFGFRQRNCS